MLNGPVLESGETGPLRCRIDNAYVRPGFRRRGHTQRMVKFLAGWAEMFEVPELDLQVAEANEVGRAAWMSLGFRVSDRPAEPRFVAMSRAARAG